MSWRSPTRRHLQLALATLWLVDAALQYQPYMFTRAFPQHVIAVAAVGQPGWVSAGVLWAARLLLAAPVAVNAGFATIQLLIAAAILRPSTARFGLLSAVGWAAGVWYFGEGLGGLAGGHASLITGAPGAALLYGVVAALAWPRGATLRRPGDSDAPVSGWAVVVWPVVWVGAAVLALLPGQRRGDGVAAALTGGMGPGWLAGPDRSAARFFEHSGWIGFAGFVAVLVAVGLAPLAGRLGARFAGGAGIGVAAACWVLGQGFGGIFSGMATDPDSAPVLMLLAMALLSSTSTVGPAVVPALAASARGRSGPIGPRGRLVLLTVTSVVLAGSGIAQATASSGAPAPAGARHSPGMSMAPGAAMPVGASLSVRAQTASAAGASRGPSKAARMICGPGTRHDVALLVGAKHPVVAVASWADHRYTCDYRLTSGALRLTVEESAGVAAARAYFAALRSRLGPTEPLRGLASLGLPGYSTVGGFVVFRKDANTLVVDATGMPALVGPGGEPRADFAYSVASDVMACWNGS